jgi:hypothetical protein
MGVIDPPCCCRKLGGSQAALDLGAFFEDLRKCKKQDRKGEVFSDQRLCRIFF